MSSQPSEIRTAGGLRLAGTLTRPGIPDSVPALLILSGSGPLDRDSNMEGQQLDVAVAIAGALAEVGVASLRYDKRGVGESDGDYLSMGFDDETSDAAAALDALRQIDGVDGSRVGIVGHSVGATIAIRLAASERGVAAAALLCAAASCGRDVMSWQSDRIAATLPGPDWLAPRWLRRRQQRARERLAAATEASLRVRHSPLPAGWIREYMAYDPVADLAAIRCPVLAVTGAKDLQDDATDVARIGSLVAGPFTGETPENLTHVLRSQLGRPTIGSYRKLLEQPVDRELLRTITSWTVSQVRPSRKT